ncbi:hypothetical protein [Chryseobacterium sp. HSC-36S06]|uniref:hypothetical protein n=1 Tax=Chryseobacterium sp. HSC-36S06 TaxID=2910970 RepID=UPI00209D7666|nr:hypothetical protein [Chryseobacterium sp. HSC-36S06]MCP2038342.1 hypothetical protein [Chryseobacterium sp. HSC-36S06]
MEDSTLLHRQIHPSFIVGKQISTQVFEISSQVFLPTPKDEGKLSVYNDDKFTAQESFEHFTKNFDSAGTVSVSVEECSNEDLKSVENNDPFDGHCYIDFGELPKNQIKKKAQRLKAHAMKRGITFLPEKI